MTPADGRSAASYVPSIGIHSIFPNLFSESTTKNNNNISNKSRSVSPGSLPPDYSSTLELGTVTPTSSSSQTSDDQLPAYDDSRLVGQDRAGGALLSAVLAGPTAPGFKPTKRFQIETVGHPLIALPLPPKPVPIPVYHVTRTGEVGDLAYTSLRDARSSSNSCVLVRAEDHSPACITTYRFGPSRPPKVTILPSSESYQPVFTSTEVSNLLNSGPLPDTEPIEISSEGCMTRSQTLRTPLGTFRWRYGSRSERGEAGPTTSSLLILERITTVHLAGGGKKEERRRRIAQLVRSDELRTEGSTRRSAGNGGKLEIDLEEWRDGKGAKEDEEEEMQRLAVATCLVMLKKEVDRRRLHQTVVLMAGASGGP